MAALLEDLSPSERALIASKRRARDAARHSRQQASQFLERLRAGKPFDVEHGEEDHPLIPMIMSRIFDESLPQLRLYSIFNSTTTAHHMLPEHSGRNRRHARLQQVSKMLRFLLDHNVLLHAVVRFHPRTRTWNVTPSYPRLVTLGQSRIATEANLRVSKVFPNATLAQLQALEDAVLDPRLLASLFDTAGFNRLVHPLEARQLYPLTVNQKATLLCAMLAELKWFVDRTRPTNRTHNNALFPPSDVLILHSLAVHSVECLMGELLWHLFESLVGKIARRWRNMDTSLVEQLDLRLIEQQQQQQQQQSSQSMKSKTAAINSKSSVSTSSTTSYSQQGIGSSSSSSCHFRDSATSWRWKTCRLESQPRSRKYGEYVQTRDGFGRQVEKATVLPAIAKSNNDKEASSSFFSPTTLKLKWDAMVEGKSSQLSMLQPMTMQPIPGVGHEAAAPPTPTAEDKKKLLAAILGNGFRKLGVPSE